MQEHKINYLRAEGPTPLLAEIAHASKRFFLPLQNLRDSITVSKSLIAHAREALHALKNDLNVRPQSHVSPHSLREEAWTIDRDDEAARVAPLRYDPLREYLLNQHLREIELTFTEIEKILGARLPKSAERPQWWANQVASSRPQREAWRAAGYDAFLVAGSRKVKFRRVS